jgi:hypothetical protein
VERRRRAPEGHSHLELGPGVKPLLSLQPFTGFSSSIRNISVPISLGSLLLSAYLNMLLYFDLDCQHVIYKYLYVLVCEGE